MQSSKKKNPAFVYWRAASDIIPWKDKKNKVVLGGLFFSNMTSASFKNAFQSKAHRERSQPSARANMGLLEKKKDYLLRAKNFHGKEKRLKALRWKALNRNPDEFYYNMVSTQTQKGVHWQSRQENYDAGTILLLKRQDSNYIRMHNQLQKKVWH